MMLRTIPASGNLSDDELSELEEYIAANCAAARLMGYRITPSVTLSKKEKCCCPMGAVLLFDGPRHLTPNLFIDVGELLGLSPGCSPEFANGFDGTPEPDYRLTETQRDLRAMGRRFRERLEAGEL